MPAEAQEALPCGVMPDFEPGQCTYVFHALQQEAVCASPACARACVCVCLFVFVCLCVCVCVCV